MFTPSGQGMIAEETRITDLENAAYLPKGRWVNGVLAGINSDGHALDLENAKTALANTTVNGSHQ